MKTNELNQKSFEDSNICFNAERGKTLFSDEVNSTSQEKEMVINCFYKCPFKASESHLMEKHYRKEHYPKSKEVFHG
jgi:hypothetical protein